MGLNMGISGSLDVPRTFVPRTVSLASSHMYLAQHRQSKSLDHASILA